MEGVHSGRHKSPYRGASPEFIDYREYNPGDEIRTIDWKAYARTDRYFIKLFEKETEMNCYILVDKSASMSYGGEAYRGLLPTHDVSKLDYAFFLTAALAYLMVKQGDKVSVSLFDSRLVRHLRPGGTQAERRRNECAASRNGGHAALRSMQSRPAYLCGTQTRGH